MHYPCNLTKITFVFTQLSEGSTLLLLLPGHEGLEGALYAPHVPGTSALCWRSPRSRVSRNQLVGINAPFPWTHRSCLPVSLQMRTDEVHEEELPCSANSRAVGYLS